MVCDVNHYICTAVSMCVRGLGVCAHVCVSHRCVPALQQRFGAPQKQPVVWVHDIRLRMGRFFPLLLRVVK